MNMNTNKKTVLPIFQFILVLTLCDKITIEIDSNIIWTGHIVMIGIIVMKVFIVGIIDVFLGNVLIQQIVQMVSFVRV